MILLEMRILAKLWKFVDGIKIFLDQEGEKEFPVFKIFKGG